MTLEIVSALLLGGLMLWLVLQPLYQPEILVPAFEEPEDPEETRKGIALIALKELDFDRETGKLSDEDYDMLRRKYTSEAVEAIREEAGREDPVEAMIAGRAVAMRDGTSGGVGFRCPRCGPRPEADARFCSSCGSQLEAPPSAEAACAQCAAPVEPGSRFCGSCGAKVAA